MWTSILTVPMKKIQLKCHFKGPRKDCTSESAPLSREEKNADSNTISTPGEGRVDRCKSLSNAECEKRYYQVLYTKRAANKVHILLSISR